MASEKVNTNAEAIESAGEVKQDPTTFESPAQHVEELNAAQHLNLTWRSWLVVFITCFAIMVQVFVVVAAGSVIAFIIRDLGDASIAGWIIRKQFLEAFYQHQYADSTQRVLCSCKACCLQLSAG